jgi:GNAT superfamily N-acetyltransferase
VTNAKAGTGESPRQWEFAWHLRRLRHRENGNCAVDLVATVPEARGRGLSSALLAQALSDAVRRGCSTTTLVAAREGGGLYERLGSKSVCPLQQWERAIPTGRPGIG